MKFFLPELRVDSVEHQLDQHGDTAFPAAFYAGNLASMTIPWHWHEELELILIYKGAVTVGAGSVITTLPAGDACFINGGILHSIWRSEGHAAVYHSVVFHPRLIGSQESIYWMKYIRPLMEPEFPHFVRFRQEVEAEQQIISDLAAAWDCAAAEREDYLNEDRYRLTRILSRMGDLSSGLHHSLSKKDLRDMERMKLMLVWVEDHFSEEITVGQIAASCGISESECLRCFKRNVGCSPLQYLIRYRLRRAAEMLATEERSISEIAVDCGFLDMSYFSRAFKADFKTSPRAYRSSLMNHMITAE